jgi:hypothetical protein
VTFDPLNWKAGDYYPDDYMVINSGGHPQLVRKPEISRAPTPASQAVANPTLQQALEIEADIAGALQLLLRHNPPQARSLGTLGEDRVRDTGELLNQLLFWVQDVQDRLTDVLRDLRN